MRAKFDSRCCKCSGTLPKGNFINYEGPGRASHMACPAFGIVKLAPDYWSRRRAFRPKFPTPPLPDDAAPVEAAGS